MSTEWKKFVDVPVAPQAEAVAILLIGETFYGTSGPEIGEVDIQLNHTLADELATKFPGESIPLYAHADAGEVDLWQARACSEATKLHETHQEIDTLRAQLAEQGALLRLIRDGGGYLEQADWDRIDLALSATAEHAAISQKSEGV